MNMLSTNEKIKKLRLDANLTQAELAQKIKIDRSVYNKIENGVRPIRENELNAIANYFNVQVDYLLGRSSEKYLIDNCPQDKDIGRKIQDIINQTENDMDLNFFGKPMSQADRIRLINALEIGLELSKKHTKLKKEETK